jgi:hypothetical protein
LTTHQQRVREFEREKQTYGDVYFGALGEEENDGAHLTTGRSTGDRRLTTLHGTIHIRTGGEQVLHRIDVCVRSCTRQRAPALVKVHLSTRSGEGRETGERERKMRVIKKRSQFFRELLQEERTQ